jgi:hypothetical protein
MVELNHTNLAELAPKAGDTLVIQTKKSGDKKIMCHVKEVVSEGDGVEIILQRSTNSFFSWDIYISGKSWVWRVWNLGQIQMTTSSNSMHKFIDF